MNYDILYIFYTHPTVAYWYNLLSGCHTEMYIIGLFELLLIKQRNIYWSMIYIYVSYCALCLAMDPSTKWRTYTPISLIILLPLESNNKLSACLSRNICQGYIWKRGSVRSCSFRGLYSVYCIRGGGSSGGGGGIRRVSRSTTAWKKSIRWRAYCYCCGVDGTCIVGASFAFPTTPALPTCFVRLPLTENLNVVQTLFKSGYFLFLLLTMVDFLIVHIAIFFLAFCFV